MPKISIKNKELLKKFDSEGIKTEKLIKKYGIFFVINLLFSVSSNEYSVPFHYPNNRNKNKIKFQDIYQKELTDAGFSFYDFDEDFVDEDTGEVVSIQRRNILCITF